MPEEFRAEVRRRDGHAVIEKERHPPGNADGRIAGERLADAGIEGVLPHKLGPVC